VENHPGLILVVLGVFAAMVYFGSGGRAPDKGTQVAIPVTANDYVGSRNADDKPDGVLEVFSPTGAAWSTSVYDGGLLYQERTQRDAKDGWTVKYTAKRYFSDYRTDLGAWTGLRVAEDRTHGGTTDSEVGVDVGLRYSPVRYAYGVISPDLLISPHQAGLGVSFYAPSQTVSPFWQRLGIGLGYFSDYRSGSGWSPYISLSTRY
jgi:hypothetical protein